MKFTHLFAKSSAVLALVAAGLAQSAHADGKLTIYCSTQNITCEKVAQAFGEKYGVETQFVRNSTGTVLGKIKAEKDNPQADVWYGGTIEPHLQAEHLNLLERYHSPKQAEILPKFQYLTKQYGDFVNIIYLIDLGMGINTQTLEKDKIAAPKCYADLLKPEFKGLIQYPDPRISGTGYSLLATFITLWGEDKAFDYIKAISKEMGQFVKSGLATKFLARGEVAVDLGFMLNYPKEKAHGAPVEAIAPCEGSGYSLGAASIIKGARNLDNAKKFIDFVLSKEAQEIPWKTSDSYQLPTNIYAKAAPGFTPAAELKLIDIDFTYFGDDKVSKRLIDKWLASVEQAKAEKAQGK